MLEPLAFSALASAIYVRPLAASYSLSRHAQKIVARSVGSTLPQDFFTPHPRRAKGKEREAADEDFGVCESSARGGVRVDDWVTPSSVAGPSSHPLPVPSGRHRARRVQIRRPFLESQQIRISPLHTWSQKLDLVQRRHASSQPQPVAVSVPNPANGRDALYDFIADGVPQLADKAWSHYDAARVDQGSLRMNVTDHILFARRIAAHAIRIPFSKRKFKHWGLRLRTVLQDLEPRLAPDLDPWYRHLHSCLTASAHAMSTEFDKAIALAQSIAVTFSDDDHWGMRYYLELHSTLAFALQNFGRAADILGLILDRWDSLGVFLTHPESPQSLCIGATAASFRASTLAALTKVEHPRDILANASKQQSREWRQRAGELLTLALCSGDSSLAQDGLHVLQELYRQGLPVPVGLQLKLVRSLTDARSFEIANPMFRAVSDQIEDGPLYLQHLRTGLYLYSHQGNVEQTENYIRLLGTHGELQLDDIAHHIYVHAYRGKPAEAAGVFERYFGPTSNRKPGLVHLTNIFLAYSKVNDEEGMKYWLDRMHDSGLTIDAYVYSIILENFASHGDLDAVNSVMERMRCAGLSPSHVAYTSIISLLARRKEPATAEIIFRRAVSEGVVPDRMMITALMNAHVEAASWMGVIHIFDYLSTTARKHGIRLTIEVYNTMLKAYVLIGAPFRVVSNLFQQLEKAKIRPDARTFSLLIQSACDAGRMKVAADLFAEMERLTSHGHATIQINIYVLTIMMSAYLRLGDRVRAKAIYDDMVRRGIEPNAVTFGAIVKAYSSTASAESLQIAENFVKDLMENDAKGQKFKATPHMIRSPLDHIYGPLLTAYAVQERPDEVVRLLQQLAESGEPSLGNLTALLDVYRRTGNIEGARDVWPQIHELAFRRSISESLLHQDEHSPTRRGQILCVPLSIYIDALSSAGYHEEISSVWKHLKSEGFTFDSHNWNHLTAALLRAGEPERAFEVLEKVILPYRRLIFTTSVPRVETPETPLITDLPPPDADVLEVPTAEAPMHSRTRRSQAVRLSTRKSKQSIEESNPDDFAHNLHVLYQIFPAWNVWRPHGLILSLLSEALIHMRTGRLIQAIRPGEDIDFCNVVKTKKDLELRSRKAEEILQRIYTNFPNACRSVRDYDNWRRTQPGGKKYGRSI